MPWEKLSRSLKLLIRRTPPEICPSKFSSWFVCLLQWTPTRPMVSIEMVQHWSAFLSDCHLSDTIRYFSDSNSENWLISHIVWGAIFFFRATQICWGKAEYAVGKRYNSGIWRSVSKLKENIEALRSITLLDDLAKSWQRFVCHLSEGNTRILLQFLPIFYNVNRFCRRFLKIKFDVLCSVIDNH